MSNNEIQKNFTRNCYITIGVVCGISLISLFIALISGSIFHKKNNISSYNKIPNVQENVNEIIMPKGTNADHILDSTILDSNILDSNIIDTNELTAELEKDNSSAKLTTLSTGLWKVGIDIPAGRYVVTTDSVGNFFVYDENQNVIIDKSFVSEELTADLVSNMVSEYGLDYDAITIVYGDLETIDDIDINSIIVNLIDGQEIELVFIENATFTPTETSKSIKLKKGIWTVGTDIDAGSYIATCEDGESGSLLIYEDGLAIVNEILGETGFGVGADCVKVDIEDGQTIHISGLNSVFFN